jgi:hypothetical protein
MKYYGKKIHRAGIALFWNLLPADCNSSVPTEDESSSEQRFSCIGFPDDEFHCFHSTPRYSSL